MAVKFGVFVPQGWRMDLVEIADPVAKFEAMTNVDLPYLLGFRDYGMPTTADQPPLGQGRCRAAGRVRHPRGTSGPGPAYHS